MLRPELPQLPQGCVFAIRGVSRFVRLAIGLRMRLFLRQHTRWLPLESEILVTAGPRRSEMDALQYVRLPNTRNAMGKHRYVRAAPIRTKPRPCYDWESVTFRSSLDIMRADTVGLKMYATVRPSQSCQGRCRPVDRCSLGLRSWLVDGMDSELVEMDPMLPELIV